MGPQGRGYGVMGGAKPLLPYQALGVELYAGP